MLSSFLRQVYFQNTVYDYLTAIGLFTALALLIVLIRIVVIRRLTARAAKTKTTFDDFLIKHIGGTLLPLLFYGSFTLSVKGLELNSMISRGIYIAGMIFMTVMGLKFVMSLMDYGIGAWNRKNGGGETRLRSLKGAVMAAKVILAGLALLLALDNMGIRISALVAGLGIGGIAVAFASQAVLADLFSFLVILFDRPFELGDFIIIDDLMGTVEHIGVKTTRLRSLNGEQLIISNTNLTNARVRNFKRMRQRRIVFKLGITYQTSTAQLKEIPGLLKNIIAGIKGASFDRAHFLSYGDFALVFEVVYIVLDSDFNHYADIQQEINLKIKEEFERRRIEFAYPTQTVFVRTAG